MTKIDFVEQIYAEREWRCQELEFCRKVPVLYTNKLFEIQKTKYWRMCIPIIYAHWEGFTISLFKTLVDYLNQENIAFSNAKECLIILANRGKFGYLQGNNSFEQQSRFIQEFMPMLYDVIQIPRESVSADSNLNYKQLQKIVKYFDFPISSKILNQKPQIERLVTFRNKIAHGENSIIIAESDVNEAIDNTIRRIDELLVCAEKYLHEQAYLKDPFI